MTYIGFSKQELIEIINKNATKFSILKDEIVTDIILDDKEKVIKLKIESRVFNPMSRKSYSIFL